MKELSIDLSWELTCPSLSLCEHSNAHIIRYNNEFELKEGAAPGWGGVGEKSNPEQALAAAISSCHVMTFLALAARVDGQS